MAKAERTKSKQSEADELLPVRHSLSHILAMAVLEVFPDAKLAIGPAIENGFYYDFDLPRGLTPEDVADLQNRMERLVMSGITFEKSEATADEAVKMLHEQPYKIELVRDLVTEGETTVSFYKSGSFTDLCKGPHVSSTKEIQPGSFRLTHAAGAYWRGSEKNPMLQRVYGLAFATKDEL